MRPDNFLLRRCMAGEAAPKLHGVVADSDMAALRERNEARRKAATERLGERYLLHPANRVHRKISVRVNMAGINAAINSTVSALRNFFCK